MSDEGRLIGGRYRLTEQIGRGGMGTVWRVQDEVLGRQVALKRLHSQPQLSDADLATLYERMRREARSAACIVHPNVVVVHDVVDDSGQPCIVMEYVPAVTLGDLLKEKGTLPPEEAARIGLGMVAALRAAHAAGVLHRDVKPGNVMLGAEGRVVLTDFGIAMTADASTLTKTGETVGSLPYMAPERIRGQKPGPASDLWALGATLYQAVEGRPPFHRDTAMEVAYAIAVDPLEPVKRAGPLAPLIESLLLKDPDQRPSAELTEQALRAARSGGSTEVLLQAAPAQTAGPVRPDEGPERRRGRKKRRVVLTAVVAVAAAAAAVTGAIHATSDRDTDAGKSRPSTAPSYTPPPVPKGFHKVTEKKFDASFPVPDGWKVIDRTSDSVTYGDKSRRVGITLGMVHPAGSHPVAHFKDIEANTKKNYSVYRRLRMQKTTFREQPAAIWEFTVQGRARTYRAIDLGFGRAGGREYDLYLSAPNAQWDTHRPVFDTFRDGFAVTDH
ncbi:serine/threonine-protein kinase [Streptomyces sp. 3N207]|uniref:serine/threonine-protein kinase n=1 Tax=Streptomyces sp. 3N207 TaxID=3457417 RepID=UPI003FD3404B